jgi:hypothetical protein
MTEMTQDLGVAASPPGHSDEPASGLAAIAGSVPNAVAASKFVYAIADIFQARHSGPLSRERAVSEAVAALEAWEDVAPFGTPDYDWSLDGAAEAAAEAMEHWESGNGQA